MEGDDPVRQALDDVCRIAARSLKAEIACIVECTGTKSASLRGTQGCNASKIAAHAGIPGLDAMARPIVHFSKLAQEPWFLNHPLRSVAPFARNAVGISISQLQAVSNYYLIVFNSTISVGSHFASVALLSDLAKIAHTLMELEAPPIQSHHILRSSFMQHQEKSTAAFMEGEAKNDMVISGDTGADSVLPFLLKTLVRQHILRSRKGTSYISVRRWRQSVKEAQVAALKALKIKPSPTVVEAIATEITEIAIELNGQGAFARVVPVPCGSSGRDQCLSVLLAERVASMMGILTANCLVRQVSSGASHPHKSRLLRPFDVVGGNLGHVLLVDDVTTTGTHVELAAKALRAAGMSASAIVWIGP